MSDLILGTAQLGMSYGIVNRSGQPSREEAVRIVASAVRGGVKSIDTARDYGTAEDVIGYALGHAESKHPQVVTKLDPLRELQDDADRDAVIASVEASVRRSSEALRTDRLDVLLLHRWNHYRKWGGTVWKHLLSLRRAGRIAALGVSVYEPIEALDALNDPDMQHLQIPVNVLDSRWRRAGVPQAIAQRGDVVVHARSPLLQGILIHGPESWPVIDGLDPSEAVRVLESLAIRFGRKGISDLCFAYIRSQPWIHGVVVGCEALHQLNENLRLFGLPLLEPERCLEIERSVPPVPDELLDPSKWKRTETRSLVAAI